MEDNGVVAGLVGADLAVGADFVEAVGAEDGAEAELAVPELDERLHRPLLLQVYPCGQHKLVPHVSKVAERLVVNSALDGNAVAFCLEISQLIADMVEQSLPVGQHIADWPLLKATHSVWDGQQKLPGRPFLLQAVYPDKEQVSALPVSSALSKRPIARAACMAAESAIVVWTVV